MLFSPTFQLFSWNWSYLKTWKPPKSVIKALQKRLSEVTSSALSAI